MAISLSVLGSGSSGNATLLSLGRGPEARHVLVDCGLSPRATARRLGPLGLRLADLSDVLVTHLDADHFAAGWAKAARRLGVTVHLHERHRARGVRLGLDGRTLSLFREPFRLGGVDVEPVLLSHDELGTVGFVVEGGGARLGFATDLGRVPRRMTDRFVDLHALAIESNYDEALQRASARPDFLKRRIMGGAGHLSNAQALAAVLEVDARSRLEHVVALHLSRQCNHPRLVQRLFAERAPHLLDRLTITSQHAPTLMLHVDAGGAARAAARTGEQLAMF